MTRMLYSKPSSVDESLFGNRRKDKPTRATKADSSADNKTTKVAAKSSGIMGNNNHTDDAGQAVNAAAELAGRKYVGDGSREKRLSLRSDDLERLKQSSRILTFEERQTIEREHERELELLREESMRRKVKMMQLEAESKKRKPKSDIELQQEEQNRHILERATELRQAQHDTIKRLNNLAMKAQTFTLRDQQLGSREEKAQREKLSDKKLSLQMEIARLEDLKRREEIETKKRDERHKDREVLEHQIAERNKEKNKINQERLKEGQDMLEKIKQLQLAEQEEEEEKRRRNAEMAIEIKKANELILKKRLEEAKLEKLENDKILEYMRKKDEELRQREEENERKKKEADDLCNRLRSMQEKSQTMQSELDELRMKRAFEAKNRADRQAELAKQKRKQDDMKMIMESRKQAERTKELTLQEELRKQKQEYDEAMAKIIQDRERQQEMDRKEQQDRLEFRKQILRQINEAQDRKALTRKAKFDEGAKLKEDAKAELEALEQFRQEQLKLLEKNGVNPKYLAEYKAYDLFKDASR